MLALTITFIQRMKTWRILWFLTRFVRLCIPNRLDSSWYLGGSWRIFTELADEWVTSSDSFLLLYIDTLLTGCWIFIGASFKVILWKTQTLDNPFQDENKSENRTKQNKSKTGKEPMKGMDCSAKSILIPLTFSTSHYCLAQYKTREFSCAALVLNLCWALSTEFLM